MGSLFVAGDARAVGPIDIEVAGIAGGGFPPSGLGVSPVGFGLGARAGVVLRDLGIYGGLSFIDYYDGYGGGAFSLPDSESISVHGLTYGVEVGYGVVLLRLITLRAQVGLGDYAEIVETSTASSSSSQTHNSPYVAPGLVAMVSLGPVLIGADASALIASFGNGSKYSTATALMLHAQLGLKF